MIHGFAVAIIVGFLYTASQNWTGVPGIRGVKLALIVALWLLGRVVMLIPGLAPTAVAAVDLAFLPVAAFFLASYLLRAGQRHNLVFLFLLAAIWLGNIAYHADKTGLTPGTARAGLYGAVHIIVAVIVVVAGRVLPFFSERAVQGYVRRNNKPLDMACAASAIAFALVSVPVPAAVRLAVAIVAAIATGLRLGLWFDKRILRLPILWILYAGYAWLVAGFVLAALAELNVLPQSTALHAFTAGSISTMIIGMVSRVTLGHTGRPIVAARSTVTAYFFVIASGLLRVFGPLLWPSLYAETMLWAGGFWIVAMALLVGRYLPMFLRPRVDGRPG
jgi:uncharacterized protein involved in response to NO